MPDSALTGYSYRTIIHPDDYQGHVVSTIIKHDSVATRKRGVLYIHGFNDYFFQKALGDSVVSHDWNFRAIDLRRYGRSLRDGNKRYSVRNLTEYFADIDSAIVDMNISGIDTVVILAHSTGGLIASYYLNNNSPTTVKGLILNSPFLDWNMTGVKKNVIVPVVSFIGSIFPNIMISQGNDSSYGKSLHADYDGEWIFDTNKKLLVSPPVSSGWIHAISSAQHELNKHADIKVPILLLHSDKSVNSDAAGHGDAVLNVNDISQRGLRLGPQVTEVSINGGLHDLILSKPEIRATVYHIIFEWLDNNI